MNHDTRHFQNPLTERTPIELKEDVEKFHDRLGLKDVVSLDVLINGALVAQEPDRKDYPWLTEAENNAIITERKSGFFQQSKALKVTILTTACAAIIQGWQQSTINASSLAWQDELRHKDGGWKERKMLAGLIDAAPWLSGSIIGTWLTDPLQEGMFGRRWALFISAIFCVACVIGSARCTTWEQLLACRLLLGIGIGSKASVAPVFAAEAAIDRLRGRLLMMWQLFDTFGIFVGFVCVWIVDHNWRVLLATASIPAIVLLFLVFLSPESPRFLIRRSDYKGAFQSLRQLRGTDIQAARDLYYIHSQLQIESEIILGQPTEGWYTREKYQQLIKSMSFPQRVWALWSIKRNRRACMAAVLVMASQQLCGINVLSFYSTSLFKEIQDADKENPIRSTSVTWLNFGFGLANFLFTIPVYKFIDSRGRRLLLLVSLGGMFFTLLAISFFFMIHQEALRIGLVASFFIGIFTLFYGIGAGPVPFTLSAEVFPLAFREVGMSFSVMVNFLGLGILVLFVPQVTESLGTDGQSKLLFVFTGLNVLAFILVFFLVPSGTARVSLEDMNEIFNKRTSEHIRDHIKDTKRIFKGEKRDHGTIDLADVGTRA